MQKEHHEQHNEPLRVRLRDFSYHLIVFVFVLVLLLMVNGISPAFAWMFVFWGFAVAMHGVYAIFGR